MKLKFYIDTHKFVTFIFILAMMAVYDRWENPTAWIYLALHGSYGLLWNLKSRIFPDKSWEERVPLWFGLVGWAALTLYWIPGWLVTWRGVLAPAWLLGLCVFLYVMGVFLNFTTDMQKHTHLKLQPDKLIRDGMFSRVRNMNYFGEFLMYLPFGLLTMTWVGLLPLAVFIAFYWTPNILRKEKALAKLAGYAEWKKRTRLIIPFLF